MSLWLIDLLVWFFFILKWLNSNLVHHQHASETIHSTSNSNFLFLIISIGKYSCLLITIFFFIYQSTFEKILTIFILTMIQLIIILLNNFYFDLFYNVIFVMNNNPLCIVLLLIRQLNFSIFIWKSIIWLSLLFLSTSMQCWCRFLSSI